MGIQNSANAGSGQAARHDEKMGSEKAPYGPIRDKRYPRFWTSAQNAVHKKMMRKKRRQRDRKEVE